MEVSILNSTKKILGVGVNDTSFDLDIITHINTAFATLNQLGVGPTEGFLIEDSEATWDSYLGLSGNYSGVKSYIYLRARLLFDPPNTSYGIAALDAQRQELEWRLNLQRENDIIPVIVVPVVPVVPSTEELILYGGDAYSFGGNPDAV